MPKNQNSPQVCPYGLYAEQLSGTAFTAPRSKNLKSWFYRIRPSVVASEFHKSDADDLYNDFQSLVAEPNQLRWDAPSIPTEGSIDFIDVSMTLSLDALSNSFFVAIFNLS